MDYEFCAHRRDYYNLGVFVCTFSTEEKGVDIAKCGKSCPYYQKEIISSTTTVSGGKKNEIRILQ